MADKQVAIRLVVQNGQRVKDEMNQVGQAGDQAMNRVATGSRRAGTALRGISADMDRMGRASRANTAQLQNASYQVGDFFVQIAAGTDVMRAAAMQLPQLLGGFGLVGAAMGMVAAVGGALIPVFMGSGESAEDFDKRVSNLESTLRRYRDAVEASRAPMAEMLDSFGKNAVSARALFETLALIERIKLTNQLAGLRDSMGGAASDIDWIVREYDAAMQQDNAGGNQVAIQAQEALRAEYGLTIEQAKQVKSALDDLARAEGPTAVAQAAQRLAEELLKARDEGAKIPPEMLAAAEEAARLAQSGYEVAGILGDAKGAAEGAAGGIAGAAAETDSWASAMAGVRAEIGAIASALASMGGGMISNASKFVELNALKQGKSIAEAARARKEAEIATEYAAREMGAGTWAERMLIRGERSLAMQGLEVDTQLDAARADARERARASAGSGRRGRSGGAGSRDGLGSAFEKTDEQIARLEEEARAFLEAASARDVYGDAADYARKKAELLAAAQREGRSITPELTAQIEEQARAYAAAAQAAEDARQRVEDINQASERGRDALGSIFDAVVEGGDAAKRAIADLLMEMAKVQFKKGMFSLLDGGGGTGDWLTQAIGSLLTFEGGGYTWDGPRSGGIDGKGGRLAILHPDETVIDHLDGKSGLRAMRGTIAAAPAASSRAPDSGRGGETLVKLELSQDLVGNILKQAGQQSVELVKAADRRLPDRIAQINRNPRLR